MKKNSFLRKSLLLATIGALFVMMVAPALATTWLDVVQPYYTTSRRIQDEHPSDSTYRSALGQSWTGNTTGYLHTIQVYLDRDGFPTGELICYVEDTTSVSDTPSGDVNDTSIARNIDEVSSSWGAFNFTFTSTFEIVDGNFYVFYIVPVEGSEVSATSYVAAYVSSNQLAGAQRFAYINGTFTTYSAEDMLFRIYLSDEVGEPPVVDPPSYYVWTPDSLLGNFVAFMVPLIVLLLPAILLMLLTRRTDKWLLFIGITIGAGLGYYFGMVPLWLVFLVTIGLIGMAYQSVRGGGGN